MPNNRDEREQEVRDKYGFVVFMGEYSLFHAILAAVDVYATGGTFTAQFIEKEFKKFGLQLVEEMSKAGLNPINEPVYVDKFIFENWERPISGIKVPLPNKFVPYVAARKKSPPPPPPPRVYTWATTEAESTSIGHIRGHDWHFAVTTHGHDKGGWVVAAQGPQSLQQLGFLAVAAMAAATNRAIRFRYQEYKEMAGSAWYLGTIEVSLV